MLDAFCMKYDYFNKYIPLCTKKKNKNNQIYSYKAELNLIKYFYTLSHIVSE